MRTVAAGLAGLILTLVLAGCVVISSTSSTQATHAAPVKLSVHVCASHNPNCPDTGNTGQSYLGFFEGAMANPDPVDIQLLFAVRLPDGAVPPTTFNATSPNTVTLTRNADFEAELQLFEAAPAGERWYGYLGSVATYDENSAQTALLEPVVTLPRPAEGPFMSPLKWRPTIGMRVVRSGLPASRAVDCGTTQDDFYRGWSESGGGSSDTTTACVDSPTPEATRGFLTAPTRDFGITGTTATVPQGGTSTVSFFAVWSGALENNQTYTLTAAGGPPGATVALDRTSVTPTADSSTPVLATVTVPPGTAPGVYDLTVSAARAGKDTRVGTSKVTVPAPAATPTPTPTPTRTPSPAVDTTKPRVTGAKLTPAKPRTGRKASLAFSLSENAAVLVIVERAGTGRKVGKRCSATARTGRRCTRWTSVGTVRATLTAGARKLTLPAKLRSRTLKRGRHRLRIVATDTARNASAATVVTFTVVK